MFLMLHIGMSHVVAIKLAERKESKIEDCVEQSLLECASHSSSMECREDHLNACFAHTMTAMVKR